MTRASIVVAVAAMVLMVTLPAQAFNTFDEKLDSYAAGFLEDANPLWLTGPGQSNLEPSTVLLLGIGGMLLTYGCCRKPKK